MSKKQSTRTETDTADNDSLNVCVVIGEVITEAIITELTDGREVVNFDLATHTDDGRTIVPVVLTSSSVVPSVGDDICAIGFVRKRFFRSGPSIQSRTEVVIERSVKVRQKAQMHRLLERAADDLLHAG